MANWTQVDEFNEIEFATCLLVTGPPDYIGWSRPSSQRKPTSTEEYRHNCRKWYDEFLGLPCTQREYDHWWLAYKTWILESREQAEGRERYHRAGHRHG